MVQILVQIPEEMARQLERIAPASSRQRSRFIRLAIQKAIMEKQEDETREAYGRKPDDEGAYFDPAVWDAPKPSVRRAAARKRSRK